jgi:pyroglutamyl-peptidase
MFRVLLTSFEPFGGMGSNSSLEIGREIARRPPAGVELEWLVLPVVAGACVEQAWSRILQMRPGLVLGLGQAAGASALRLECRGVNENDFGIPDNDGQRLVQQPIVSGGPTFYSTTAHPSRMARALSWHDVPVQLSVSAGRFVCNNLYFGLLHRAATAAHTHQTAFIHLPLLHGQVAGEPLPAMSLGHGAEGVRRAIQASMQSDKHRSRPML